MEQQRRLAMKKKEEEKNAGRINYEPAVKSNRFVDSLE